MKSRLLSVFLLLSVAVNAQMIRQSDIQTIKKSKLIVGLPKDTALGAGFKKALKEFWTFTEVTEFMPVDQAIEKANTDETCLVIKLGTTTSRSLATGSMGAKNSYASNNNGSTAGFDDSPYRSVSTGQQLEIIGKKKKQLASVYVPMYSKENYVTTEILYFGVAALQTLVETMDKNQMNNNMKLQSTYNDAQPKELKNKTLLLPDGWLSEKTTETDVKTIYPGKAKVVTYEVWRDAILSRNSDYAYSIIVPFPIGGDYIYQHYLMDAKNGVVYGIAAPKAPVNFASPLGKVNMSKANTGYINNKMLNLYSDIYGK